MLEERIKCWRVQRLSLQVVLGQLWLKPSINRDQIQDHYFLWKKSNNILLYNQLRDIWTNLMGLSGYVRQKRLETPALDFKRRPRYHTLSGLTEIILKSPSAGTFPAHCNKQISLLISVEQVRSFLIIYFIKAANRQSEPANVRGWIHVTIALLDWIWSQANCCPSETSGTVV